MPAGVAEASAFWAGGAAAADAGSDADVEDALIAVEDALIALMMMMCSEFGTLPS
jgi:hypothetical protein